MACTNGTGALGVAKVSSPVLRKSGNPKPLKINERNIALHLRASVGKIKGFRRRASQPSPPLF
jgi:hypothetical protein